MQQHPNLLCVWVASVTPQPRLMANIRRMYGKLCNVPDMYWNAIKVFTYPLECLSDVFWVIAWFGLGTSPWAFPVQITTKSPKRHHKDIQPGKWTLLLHFSAYSGHRMISHTFFLCSPLTLAICGDKPNDNFIHTNNSNSRITKQCIK